jgi:hypothetical protein
MGSYTQLAFGAKLKSSTPSEVIEFLQADNKEQKELRIKYEFLNIVQICDSCDNDVSWYQKIWFDYIWQDKESNCYYVITDCSIKNYNDEIEEFLEWIKPYIDYGVISDKEYKIRENPKLYPPNAYDSIYAVSFFDDDPMSVPDPKPEVYCLLEGKHYRIDKYKGIVEI